jgi:hypothetical protein
MEWRSVIPGSILFLLLRLFVGVGYDSLSLASANFFPLQIWLVSGVPNLFVLGSHPQR